MTAYLSLNQLILATRQVYKEAKLLRVLRELEAPDLVLQAQATKLTNLILELVQCLAHTKI